MKLKINSKTSRIYFVIAELGVEDDDECTKGEWLKTKLEAVASSFRSGVPVIEDKDAQWINNWARDTFDSRPEYYVCIFESASAPNFGNSIYKLIYVSHDHRAKVKKIANSNLSQQIAGYQRQISHAICNDNDHAEMEKRRKKRDSK